MEDKVCLFDMDGTLCDLEGVMFDMLEDMRNPLIEPALLLLPRYDEKPKWLKTRLDMIKSHPGFWLSLPPIKAGFDIMDMAKEIGFHIHILTQGPRKADIAWLEKKKWCKRHIPYDYDITITQNKALVYGRVLVDDWPPYFLKWLKFRPRGLVVAVKQLWNSDVKHPNVILYDGSNGHEVFDRMKQALDRE